MSINLVFNVVDLFPYRNTFEPPLLPPYVYADISFTPVPRAPSTTSEPPDEILDVLDDEFVTSHFAGNRGFFVR